MGEGWKREKNKGRGSVGGSKGGSRGLRSEE